MMKGFAHSIPPNKPSFLLRDTSWSTDTSTSTFTHLTHANLRTPHGLNSVTPVGLLRTTNNSFCEYFFAMR